MLLNHEEILAHPHLRLENRFDKNLTQVSYNLSIGKILDSKGAELEEYIIQPQGIVNIISREFLQLPDDLIAYATVKNGMSRKGLLAINIGLIDPGYRGLISSHLINFGRQEITIKKNQQFLRLTFHKINLPSNNRSLSTDTEYQYTEQSYKRQRKEESMAYLGKRFLSMEKTVDEIKTEVMNRLSRSIMRWFAILGLFGTFLAVLISILTGVVNISPKGDGEELRQRIETLEMENKALMNSMQVIKKDTVNGG